MASKRSTRVQLYRTASHPTRKVTLPLVDGRVRNSRDIAAVARAVWGGYPVEESGLVIVLDYGEPDRGRNGGARVIGAEEVGRGDPDSTAIHHIAVVRLAIALGATQFAIVHSHPVGIGQERPSRQDEDMTHELASMARSLDMRLVDHVVVSGERHFSFRDARKAIAWTDGEL